MTAKTTQILSWVQIAFFYFVGVSIFFIVAFVIVNLRISCKGEINVPSLVGKMYLDEHNRLEKAGFRVELEKIYSLEYPYGYILSQNLSAGDAVKFGQKLTLIVNQSKAVVETPKLVGSLASLAPKILGNIHSRGRRYKLNVGVVTHIPSKYPKDEILAQYPPPRTPVIPEYPVSFLVSYGNPKTPQKVSDKNDSAEDTSKDTSSNTPLPAPKEINQLNIEIVKKIAYHLKIPLEIETAPTSDPEENGFVLESERLVPNMLHNTNREKTWKITVAKYKSKEAEAAKDEGFNYPFHFIWLNTDDLNIEEGSYVIGKFRSKTTSGPENGISYIAFKKNKKVPFFKGYKKEDLLIWKDYLPMQPEGQPQEENDSLTKSNQDGSDTPNQGGGISLKNIKPHSSYSLK